jgi:hypothetical protein
MGWWTAFDPAEVAADFGRLAGCGFDSVRIFLTWEDFQPTPSRVDSKMVDRLVSTLDEASTAGLSVMPTLFTGHMSGVNWIPSWALGEEAGNDRFRVVSGGRVTASRLASWYSDASIIEAQSVLAREVAGALAGHAALWAWDLGNENSNCAVPPDKAHAREWLLRVTDAIRAADPRALVTLGLHMEDLEQDRNLGPREAAEVCDFLQMHGYPGYASWADGPTDERVLPFLARLTRWLGGGADVLFAEFGVPTKRRGEPAGERSIDASGPALVDEQAAASYIDRALGSGVIRTTRRPSGGFLRSTSRSTSDPSDYGAQMPPPSLRSLWSRHSRSDPQQPVPSVPSRTRRGSTSTPPTSIAPPGPSFHACIGATARRSARWTAAPRPSTSPGELREKVIEAHGGNAGPDIGETIRQYEELA